MKNKIILVALSATIVALVFGLIYLWRGDYNIILMLFLSLIVANVILRSGYFYYNEHYKKNWI